MKNRIKQVRKNANLTQKKFADALNISQNFANQVETGNRNPSDRTILDICRVFNINENWLRTGEGDMYADVEDPFMKVCIEIGATDLRLQNLIMRFWSLSKEKQQLFWDFIDSIPKKETE